MEVRMNIGMCGPDLSLVPGDPHECELEEAVRLVQAGFASTTNDEDAKVVAEAIAAFQAVDAEPAEETAADPANSSESENPASETVIKPNARRAGRAAA